MVISNNVSLDKRARRIFTLLLAVIALLGCVSIATLGFSSEDSEAATVVTTVSGDGVNYTLYSDKTAVVADGDNAVGDVIIPSIVKYEGEKYTVVEIAGSTSATVGGAFENNDNITSLTIPASVTKLGGRLCYDCDNLVSVTINANVVQLGGYSFQNCDKLKDVTLPETLTGITAYEFAECISLESITFPDSVTTLYSSVFYGCTALKTVGFNDGLLSIGGSAFMGCTALKTIDLPDSVTTISANAFNGCTSLTAFKLPDSLSSWMASAVANCPAIVEPLCNSTTVYYIPAVKEAVIPEGVTTAYGSSSTVGAAIKNTVLESVKFPDTFETVSMYAFSGCTSLKELNFPASVKTIGNYAFQNCKSLEKVTFASGSALESIGNYAFSSCSSLATIVGIPDSASPSTSAFNGTVLTEPIICSNYPYYIPADYDKVIILANVLYYVPTSYTSYEIPKDVTDLGSNVFKGGNLESITVPKMNTLGTYIFANCTKLTTVVLEEGFTSIGAYMFSDCTALENVTLPSTLTTVGSYAFKGCSSLSKIVLPATVETVEAQAFAKTAIEEIDLTNVQTIGNYVFQDCKSLKSATISSTASIGTNLFRNSGLTTYTLPAGLTTVPQYMFYGCTSLESVVIPSSVTKIDSGVFYNCSALKSIDLPNGITTFGMSSFRDSGLTEIEIPESVTSLGTWMFGAKLTKITINGNVSLPNYLFAGSTNLTDIYLNGDISLAGKNVFYRGPSAYTIHVSNGVGFTGYSYSGLTPTTVDGGVYVPVKLETADGSVNGSMLAAATGTALHIAADCVAIAPDVLKNSYTGITVSEDNKYFSVLEDGSIVFNGNTLVYGPSSDVALYTVPDSISMISSVALSHNTGIKTLVLPASIKEIGCDAVSSDKLEVVIFNSVPLLHKGAFSADNAMYFVSDSAYFPEMEFNGIVIDGYCIATDSGNVLLAISGIVEVECDVYGDDLSLFISLPSSYADSEVNVEFRGVSTVLWPGTSGVGFVLSDIVGNEIVNVTGVELNEYDVSYSNGTGYIVSLSQEKDVPFGTTVTATITLENGYSADETFTVTFNGTALIADSVLGRVYTYSFTVESDSVLKVSGVVPSATYTVSFDVDGGSAVADQKVVSNHCATVPDEPTKSGSVFAGWYSDSECKSLFDFASEIIENTTVYAKWVSDSTSKVKLTFTIENGKISATINGVTSVSSGSSVKVGDVVTVTAMPREGYEVIGWKINNVYTHMCQNEYTFSASEDTQLVPVLLYITENTYDLITDTKTPTNNSDMEIIWTLRGITGMTGGFGNIVYTPCYMGDYLYAKSGPWLYKIDPSNGDVVNAVQTAPSYSGYYEYIAVGDGLIFDGITGKVFDADLNQVYTTGGLTDINPHYYKGAFYVFANGACYKFSTIDEDPSDPSNVQSSLKIEVPTTADTGGVASCSTRVFYNNVMLCMLSLGDDRAIASYDINTGKEIDRFIIKEFKGTSLNMGYISYFDGVVYATCYGVGWAGGSDVNYNLVRIDIDRSGVMDDSSAKVYYIGETSSYVSSVIIVGEYAYVHAGTTMLVLNKDTMEVVASAESVMSHGNLGVSTGYLDEGKVYAYMVPYNMGGVGGAVLCFEHDLSDPTNLKVEYLTGFVKQYSSQMLHWGPDGSFYFYNDSGYTMFAAKVFHVDVEYNLDVFEGYTTSVTYGNVLNVEVPVGYSVEGLFTDTDLTVPWVPETAVTADMTIYVKLVALPSEILFYDLDGSPLPGASIVGSIGDEVTGSFPTIIVPSGYKVVWTDADGKPVSELPATFPAGGAEYFATTVAIEYSYTVNYVADDGTVLRESDTYTAGYGTKVSAKEESEFFTAYGLISTSGDITISDDVSKNVITLTYHKYPTITWVIDGKSESVVWNILNVVPTYDGTPEKTGEGKIYTFTGWDPEVAKAWNDATYTAQFSEADVTCKIVYGDGLSVSCNGKEVPRGESVVYGSTVDITVQNREGFTYVVTANGTALTELSGVAITADTAFEVEYVQIYHTISISGEGVTVTNNGVAVSDGDSVAYGTVLSVSLAAKEGSTGTITVSTANGFNLSLDASGFAIGFNITVTSDLSFTGSYKSAGES